MYYFSPARKDPVDVDCSEIILFPEEKMKKPGYFIKWRSCIVIMLLIGSTSITVQAKNWRGLDTIRIDTVKLFAKLLKPAKWYLDNTHSITVQQLPNLLFTDSIPIPIKVSNKLIQNDIYLKFIVTNSADSNVSFYFSPGIYFREIDIYRLHTIENKFEKLPDSLIEIEGVKTLELGPHQTNVFIAKLTFVKTNAHAFEPVLIRDYFLNSYTNIFQNSGKDNNTVTFVFSGILLMMIFYSIAVYILNGSIEFLYYTGFAFCLGLMFFLKSYLFRTSSSFNYFFEAYLDFVMQSVGTFIYLAFLKKFIDAKKNFPWLHKMLSIEQIIIIISISLFSFLYFNNENYTWLSRVENLSKDVWILGTIIFIIYTIRKNNKLLNYLAVGHTLLLIGGSISLYLINSPSSFRAFLPAIFSNALIYYELGLAAELMVFLAVLAFKNRTDIVDRTKERERLKLRTEMQDFEKQLAVLSAQQDERTRISADLHDELGSGLTGIRLMSEIVKTKMKGQVLPEIERISNAANDLVINMNALVWTMKSENDTVESLITYMRIYALEFFDNTSVECIVDLPPVYPKNLEISGEKRRNIFLTIKETFNNILKHSKADRLVISVKVDKRLIISISDNGVGIDFDKLRQFGSGLGNIKKRMERAGGTYKIENNPEKGTRTTLELTL
ncbi:MAG: 7TM diverse intracellular signaling domain-containing protein [Chitinophagaceae bacterium]